MKGGCSPAERARFEQWWSEHPREVDAWFERVWAEQPEHNTRERAEIWEHVKPGEERRGYFRGRRGGFFRWAAVAALVIGLCGYLLTRHRHEAAPVTLSWATLTNDSAKPRHYLLPDSTGVWLNGHSSLAYNNRDRRTRLSGEAFFTVRKDPARPFSVEVPGMVTKVLGTSFNIDAYPGERAVHLALVQGAVGVWAGRDSIVLKPGDMVTLGARGLVKGRFAVNDVSAWTQGKLVLDQVDLTDVMRRITLQTGVTVDIDPRVARRSLKISGIYDMKSVGNILASIAFVHSLRVIRRQKDHYYLNY
ncbi:FecR family protein [Dinghuibacter silviterrae]|nr:FecR domain-containing protein [Dinghuibacter silviterrae]